MMELFQHDGEVNLLELGFGSFQEIRGSEGKVTLGFWLGMIHFPPSRGSVEGRVLISGDGGGLVILVSSVSRYNMVGVGVQILELTSLSIWMERYISLYFNLR